MTRPVEVGIDDRFAVFLGERREPRRRQDVEHRFRRPAQAGAQRRHDDRPVHQVRMRDDEVDELVVGPARVIKLQFVVGRALLAQHTAH